MSDDVTDVVTTQDTIIRMQSKVIPKLFLQFNEIAKLRN